MKNVVITGATGPLGVALTELLVSKNIGVTAIVRKDSPRISNVPNHSLVRMIEADLSQLRNLERDFKLQYDVFFHLGWANTANRTDREDIDAHIKNIQYALDAVRLANKISCSVFIGAGSQSEYGEVNEPILESTQANPVETYGVAKLAAMSFCRNLCSRLDIRFGWLRILSMYGPYDRDTTFISYCITELLNGRTPKLTSCEQLWDYIYSKDAAEAFWLLADKGKPDAVYALSSGTAQPLHYYAKTLRNMINPEHPLGFGELPYPQGQRMCLTADISPLNRDLKFVPAYTFEQGIVETIEYHILKRNLLR